MFVDTNENLKDYGFTQADFLAAQNTQIDKNLTDFIPARIIEGQRERFKVICEHGELSAEIKGSFYHNLETCDLFPVVGDFVLLKYNSQGASLIGAVLPRRSMFSRADFSGHAAAYVKNIQEQVLASNFDYVFILTSMNHDLNINRLTRYLTAAWQSGGFPVVVLTKADLYAANNGDDLSSKIAEIRKYITGISSVQTPVIAISSKTGFGIEELAPFMEPAKTLIFLGSSGVGKSSLLNRLAGEELMNVKAIRDDDSKGRHTTTHRQLFRLSNAALIIDTPGMRELGLLDSNEGMSAAFAEVEELFSNCRFSDCTHRNEPGCAVQAALEDGSLSMQQWKQYMGLRKEAAFVENHSAYLKQKRALFKSIARVNRVKNNS